MDGEAEWSRVESPPGCIPTTPTTPTMPRYSPYYLLLLLHGCSSAADRKSAGLDEKNRNLGQAGRTMSPSPACLTATRFCRLTTRRWERSRASIMRPAASRLQPRPPSSMAQMAVVGAMCALEITTAKPEDSSTFPCQPTSFLPCRPFIHLLGGSGRGVVAHTREDIHRSGSSDQQPSWRERGTSCFVLPGRLRPSPLDGRAKGKKVVVPGWLCCEVAYAQC